MLLLFLSATGYAFLPILTKIAYNEAGMQPLDFVIWRFLFATPCIWLLLLVSGGLHGAGTLPRFQLLGAGAVFAAGALCSVLALARVPASTYTVLIYTYPAIVALMLLVIGERLAVRGWLALAITLVGVLLTVPNVRDALNVQDNSGVWIALANSAAYALYIVLSSRILRGHSNLGAASALSITGTLLALLLLVVGRGLTPPATAQGWLVMLGVGTVATVLPTFTFYAGMKHVGAGQAAIFSTLEPVLVLMLSFLLLREQMVMIQIVGAALILAGALILQLNPHRPSQTAAQPAGD
jgi:drug/metabolite transporter (DMT)-like permease